MPLETLLIGGKGEECNASSLQENWLETCFFSLPTIRNSGANMKYVLLQTPAFESLHHKITLRGSAQSIYICTERKNILRRKEQLPNKTFGILCMFHIQSWHSFSFKNHCLGVEGDKTKNRSHGNPVCINLLIHCPFFSCIPFLSSFKTLPCSDAADQAWLVGELSRSQAMCCLLLQWYICTASRFRWVLLPPVPGRQRRQQAVRAARRGEPQVAHAPFLPD